MFGRSFRAAGKRREGRYCGVFFFLSLGNHEDHTGIYNISEITKGEEDCASFFSDTAKSPVGAAHFWGRPVWGYYRSADPWVLTREVELLTLAGVDFLALDVSNMVIYEETVDTLLEVLLFFQNQGWDVPRVWFYCNQQDPDQMDDKEEIKRIYLRWYTRKCYRDLWFAPEGKPLVTKGWNTVWDTEDPLEREILETFQFRLRQWPTEDFNEEGIPWIEFFYPQRAHDGWMNVSAAEHAVTIAFSDLAANWGRGYDFITGRNETARFREGINFSQQWDTVFASGDEVRYVFITGWNEWVAQKMIYRGRIQTVDQFNEEYSRDIEPEDGALEDSFYLQMAGMIRKWKYEPGDYLQIPFAEINENSESPDWGKALCFLDFTGDTARRDFPCFDGSFRYTDGSGRNDIAAVRVLRDRENLLVRIETVNLVTERTEDETCWMNLFLLREGERMPVCVIGRSGSGGRCSVETVTEGGRIATGFAGYRVRGNAVEIAVPLKNLPFREGDAFLLKAADNLSDPENWMEFYTKGDSAPIGSLGYCVRL